MTKKDAFIRLAVLFSFSALLLVFKYSCLALPAYNDEWNYIFSTSAVYYNNLNPFVQYWGYHPPVFVFSAALLFKLFGPSLFVVRLAILFFSLLTLYFTFLLGKMLYGVKTGVLASVMLFFSPHFFAQSALFYSDALVTALTIATVYYFLSGKKGEYLIAGSLLVLTKEPAILVPVSIAVYKALLSLPEIIQQRRQPDISRKMRKDALEILFVLSPLSLFLAWMGLNKLLLGWFLCPVNSTFFLNFTLSPRMIGYILNGIFWMDHRYLLVLAILAAVSLPLFRKEPVKRFLRKEFLLFAVLAFISIIFFAGLSGPHCGFSLRYVLFVEPLLFIAGTAALIQLTGNRAALLTACALIIFAFVSRWHCGGREEFDTNLTYQNIVRAHKEAARYLSENFSSSFIVAAVPFKFTLTNPLLGYVARPCPNVSERAPEKYKKTEMVIAISQYYRGWTDAAAEIIKFRQDSKARLLKIFTSGSGEEEILIYGLP